MNVFNIICVSSLLLSNFSIPLFQPLKRTIDENTDCQGNPACIVIKGIKQTGKVTKDVIDSIITDPMQFARDLGTFTGEAYNNSIFGKIAQFTDNYTGSY